MKDISIELPPLPRPQVPRIDADIDLMDIRRLVNWCEKTANEHARAAIEADRKQNDRMLVHEWIRPALGLSEDAPYRFDFYAQQIEGMKAEHKHRGVNSTHTLGEPVVLATYHAIVDESEKHIVYDTRTNQLEIYDERVDAVKAAPDHLSVVPVYVTATEGPLYTAPQPAEPSGGESVAWERFPGYLIEQCEGEIITEEGLQRALADMLGDPEYTPRPAEPVASSVKPTGCNDCGITHDRLACVAPVAEQSQGDPKPSREPVGWITPSVVDMLRDGKFATVCPTPFLVALPVYLAPQPAEPVKVPSMIDLIADDAYAATFQSVGQYRKALLARYGQPDHFRDAAQMIETHATDAQRWRKARTLPRSWWRDAFNRIAAEGITLDALIDAETKRRLP